MKQLLLIGFLLVSAPVFSLAQTPIMLTKANTPLATGPAIDYSANVATVPVPSIGSNQGWDYHGVTFANMFKYSYSSSANPHFPSGTVQDSANYDPLVTGYGLLYNQIFQKSDTAVSVLGVEFPSQAYTVQPLSGNAADSIWIADQTVVYPTPVTYLPFPLNSQSNYTSTFHRSVDAKLTLTAYGLNKADFLKVSGFARSYSTVGWGNLTMPSANNPNGQTLPALLVRRSEVRVDSFYLGGAPAPAQLLTAFGLTQGMVTKTYREYFYVAGMMMPAFGVYFTDSTYTTVASAYATVISTAAVASASTAENAASIYPNPVKGNQLHVAFSQDEHLSRVELVNLLGEIVSTTSVSGGGSFTLPIPASLSAGDYVVRTIDSKGGPIQCSKVSIVR